MPLQCASLSREILSKLNHDISRLPIGNILRKESMDGDITVTLVENNSIAIYHSAAGFYFLRIEGSLEDTIRKDIQTPREYLCSVFEMDPNDPSVKQRLLNRFQEAYGQKLFQKMDYVCFDIKGAPSMLVKLPSCILRHLLAPSGGTLRTIFSGPTKSLLEIPTLTKLANIDPKEEYTSSVFVTEYDKGMLPFVVKIHYDIVRELVKKPNLGITIGPVGVWDA